MLGKKEALAGRQSGRGCHDDFFMPDESQATFEHFEADQRERLGTGLS